MIDRIFRLALALFAIELLLACGGGSNDNPSPYFPYNKGNRWNYQATVSVNEIPQAAYLEFLKITGTANVDREISSVMKEFNPSNESLFGGRYIVKEDAVYYAGGPNGEDDFGLGIYKIANLPLRIKDTFIQLDRSGIEYGADIDFDGQNETFAIVSNVEIVGQEDVTVPAGSFTDCMLLQTDTTQTLTLSATTDQFILARQLKEWYAPNIGVVKRVLQQTGIGYSESREFVLEKYYVNGNRSEMIAPEVVSSQPLGTSGGGTAYPISVQFSEAMDPTTFTPDNFYLVDSLGQQIAGEAYYTAENATFFPVAPLGSENYTATISTGIEDLAGNRLLSPYDWTFSVDVTPPEVVATFPMDLAEFVDRDKALTVRFSEEMTPSSFNDSSFILKSSFGDTIPGTIVYDYRKVTFNPKFPLQLGATYTAMVARSVQDIYGNELGNDFSWSFTVEPPLFGPSFNIPTGSAPEAIAIGDVNDDGRNDVVLTTFTKFDPVNDYMLFVFLQDVDGSLLPAIKYSTGGSFSAPPQSVDIGDVNNDGRNDIIVGKNNTSIEVFLQTDNGGLAPRVSYPIDNSRKIAVADLNNDGLLDVVGAARDIEVFYQRPDGTLGTPVVTTLRNTYVAELRVEDFNKDGLLDVATGIACLFQVPAGGLSAPVYYSTTTGVIPSSMGAGDVNGDGLSDVVVSTGGNSPDSAIEVILQNSSGLFDPPIRYVSYDIPGSLEVVDANGDGLQDIIVMHEGWSAMGVYLQGAEGQLLPEELFSSVYSPRDLAIGDINGDGKNDAVIAEYFKGLVIHYNTGSQGLAPTTLGVSPRTATPRSLEFKGVKLR